MTEQHKDFEAFYLSRYGKSYMRLNQNGTYQSSAVQHAWIVWQEAQAQHDRRIAERNAKTLALIDEELAKQGE